MLSQAWLHLEPPTSSPRGRAVSAPIVLVAEELSPAAIALLEPDFEVRHTDGANRAEALAHAPRLRVVARAGVGLDNVDVSAATKAGVMVVNAPSSNIVSAAEHT